MVGFALHPLYADTARQIPDTAVSGIGALGKIAVYYYRRPSPQRGSVHKDEESNDEDPGDSVDGAPTLSVWGEYLVRYLKSKSLMLDT
ncbi:hypothetical protein GQ600_15797 [Phytophthora cactorum]|nr:hypothetical protein GQ600_15797 [Phytophthora cactorum]